MSLDYFVYSKSSQPLNRSEITSAMRAVGWEIMFVDDYHNMSIAQGDKVSKDEFIIGWGSNPEITARVQGVFARRDLAGLEELFEEMIAGGCEISARTHNGIEDEEGIPGDIRPDYRHALSQAKTCYYFRTAAGRSPLSAILQGTLWKSIGKISHGLLEDPQCGKYYHSHESPPPKSIAESIDDLMPKPPMTVIDWYIGLALCSLFLAITGKIPIIPRVWYVGIMCIYGSLAYGLYLGHKWVWQISVGLNGIIILVSIFCGFFCGLGFAALPGIVLNAYLLYHLLSFETKLYFA